MLIITANFLIYIKQCSIIKTYNRHRRKSEHKSQIHIQQCFIFINSQSFTEESISCRYTFKKNNAKNCQHQQ